MATGNSRLCELRNRNNSYKLSLNIPQFLLPYRMSSNAAAVKQILLLLWGGRKAFYMSLVCLTTVWTLKATNVYILAWKMAC